MPRADGQLIVSSKWENHKVLTEFLYELFVEGKAKASAKSEYVVIFYF